MRLIYYPNEPASVVVVDSPPLWSVGGRGLRRGPGDRWDIKERERREKVRSQARSKPKIEGGKGSGVGRAGEKVGCGVGSRKAGRAVGVVRQANPLTVGK